MPTEAGSADAAGSRRSTHRLLPAEVIESRYGPAAARYILEVRQELLNRYGEVDTYQLFAADIKRCLPPSMQGGTRTRILAKRRAEHFNQRCGPPWATVEEVLYLAVCPDRRAERQQRFQQLHDAVRPVRGRHDPAGAEQVTLPGPGQREPTARDLLVLHQMRYQGEMSMLRQELSLAYQKIDDLTATNADLQARVRVAEVSGGAWREEMMWLQARMGFHNDQSPPYLPSRPWWGDSLSEPPTRSRNALSLYPARELDDVAAKMLGVPPRPRPPRWRWRRRDS